jgi:uncharacterized membrane protein
MQARHVLAATASVAYVAGSQWLMLAAPSSPWSAVALLLPMLAVACGWAWQAQQRSLSLCAAAAIVALLWRAAAGGEVASEKLYVAQHALIHACLAAAFGATLRPGRTPLVTTLAARVHRQLTAPMRAYTRNVTFAWTMYFVAMTVLSLVLYAVAPFEAWATFANLLTPLALAVMFGGEYLLRYRLHPDFERVTIFDAIRAYHQPDAHPPGPAPAAPPPAERRTR